MRVCYPGDIDEDGRYILGPHGKWQLLEEPEWCSEPRWPWLARQQRKLTAVGAGFSLVLGMVVVQVEAGAAAEEGDGEITVHQAAVDLATECYDDTMSSNGTSEPGSWSFKLCLDNVTYLGEYLRKLGVRVVDGGGAVVPYGMVGYEVGDDLFSWMKLGWKPS